MANVKRADLEEELNYLKNYRMKEIYAVIRECRERINQWEQQNPGEECVDLEYEFAMEEKARTQERITRLEELLKTAE